MTEANCIRSACIANDDDLYHVESHVCFVCGAEFDPTPDLRQEICSVCGWYRCPFCDGCECSLSREDAAWIDHIHTTACQSIADMANLNVGSLPETENPNVKVGLGMQLRFCRRWAIEQLRR